MVAKGRAYGVKWSTLCPIAAIHDVRTLLEGSESAGLVNPRSRFHPDRIGDCTLWPRRISD